MGFAPEGRGLDLVCVVHVDLDMCFAPHWRPKFRQRNFQRSLDECFPPVEPLSFEHLTWKCASRHSGMPFFTSERPKVPDKSGPRLPVLLAFWLEKNAFGAIVACQFSTSKLPKVVHTSCVFDHFGLEMRFAPQRRALFHFSSRHMAPRPRFSEPTSYFSTLPAHKSEKRNVLRLASHFARLYLLSSDSFSVRLLLYSSTLLLVSSLFYSYFLCLSPPYIVGSLTCKLPLASNFFHAFAFVRLRQAFSYFAAT